MDYNKIKMFFPIAALALFGLACGFATRMPLVWRKLETQNLQPETGLANGERIYFTAINAQGEQIEYRAGPNFGGMMMGAYLTCAACHGPEGSGGVHNMHMYIMNAPAITYNALSDETEEHGDGNSGEHSEYDLETFRMAVVEGEHPDGKPLDADMPRWQISDADLQDLFEFLKSLP